MALADNTISPLEIPDAREAAHAASENQRGCEDRIRKASRELADAERKYRSALSTEIVHQHAKEGAAWSTAPDIARGKKKVADLRFDRDVAAGVLEAAKQEAFRRGADRRDLDTLLRWSMHRDLRTDTPPASWFEEHGVDRQTGEVRA